MSNSAFVSGQSWTGALPNGWAGLRSKRVFGQSRQRAEPKDEQLSVTQKGGIVRQTELLENGQRVVLALTGTDNFKHVEIDDFVISLRSFQGGIEWSNVSGCVSPAYTVLRASTEIAPRYWSYLFKSAAFITALRSVIDEGIRDGKSITYEQFGETVVPVPPLSVQVVIAAHLDRATSRIDTLVAKKTRFIELLREKRQALITHAVTKGLDPNVPMKDSAIEWLGEVPAHWLVGPVKRFFSSLDSRRVPLSSEERGKRTGEFPYYGASGVIDHIDDYIFDEDLILVSEDGANLTYRSTPISFVASGKYWVNNHAHILRPMDGCLKYWSERIESLDLIVHITGSTQPKLTIESLMNIPIAVPSTSEERQEITDFIVSKSRPIDALIAKTERSIELLREHRTALITAAVTGQIDLRPTT